MIRVSGGIGPVLNNGQLRPYKVFEPGTADGDASYGLQVVYMPDYSTDNGIGLVASHTRIPLIDQLSGDGGGRVDLDVIGLFLDYGLGPWQVASTVYSIKADFVDRPGGRDSSFWSGYLQLTRRLGNHFSALARVEESSGADNSSYVALFDGYVDSRNSLGFRWDFYRHQALSLEWSDTRTLNDSYREYRIQWSAVFP
jgi:hypothetical protein